MHCAFLKTACYDLLQHELSELVYQRPWYTFFCYLVLVLMFHYSHEECQIKDADLWGPRSRKCHTLGMGFRYMPEDNVMATHCPVVTSLTTGRWCCRKKIIWLNNFPSWLTGTERATISPDCYIHLVSLCCFLLCALQRQSTTRIFEFAAFSPLLDSKNDLISQGTQLYA